MCVAGGGSKRLLVAFGIKFCFLELGNIAAVGVLLDLRSADVTNKLYLDLGDLKI